VYMYNVYIRHLIHRTTGSHAVTFHTYIHTYIYTYMSCGDFFMHTHTYIHTYIHAYDKPRGDIFMCDFCFVLALPKHFVERENVYAYICRSPYMRVLCVIFFNIFPSMMFLQEIYMYVCVLVSCVIHEEAVSSFFVCFFS
jgi:hypothetical protein